jgi:hypothetical protein
MARRFAARRSLMTPSRPSRTAVRRLRPTESAVARRGRIQRRIGHDPAVRTADEIREALGDLVGVALSDNIAERARGVASLRRLGGRDWLRLDDVARGPAWSPGLVTGDPGQLAVGLSEQSGLVAVVLSMHADGHYRQRATRVLAARPGPLSAAALAVRCLDHVAQVRGDALAGLLAHTSPDDVGSAVAVLAAGAQRARAGEVLARYTHQILAATGGPANILALRASPDPGVQRWACRVSLAHDLVSASDVVTAVLGEADQWVRVHLTRWLRGRASVQQLLSLVASKFVDGRLVAAELLPDAELADGWLHALLLDASPRVREVAQGRAGPLGVDVAAFYRTTLDLGGPRRTARCIAELGRLGDASDVPRMVSSLEHAAQSVRAAAVTALGRLDRAAALASLEPMLLDPGARVSAAASLALVRAGAGAQAAVAAWSSGLPGSRRAAWRLHRASGRWNRVEASLRAATDADPALRRLGSTDLIDWLRQSAATCWHVPDDDQRARLSALLDECGLDEHVRRQIAFHAGIPFVARSDR